MIAIHLKNILTISVLTIALSACQTIDLQTAMPDGRTTPPPSGYKAMCAREPAECVLPMDRATSKELLSLHNMVKDLIIPTPEQGDFWQSVSTRSEGDCEDFALTLRKYLREAMPEYGAAFLLATAYTETAQYHAVLTIETASGTLVCDVRFPQCAPWESFPYDWHLREVAGQSNWENIGDDRVIAGIMVANLQAASTSD